VIEISPMSGLSNVKCWLEEHGYDHNNYALAQSLFDHAKKSQRLLSEAECHHVLAEVLAK